MGIVFKAAPLRGGIQKPLPFMGIPHFRKHTHLRAFRLEAEPGCQSRSLWCHFATEPGFPCLTTPIEGLQGQMLTLLKTEEISPQMKKRACYDPGLKSLSLHFASYQPFPCAIFQFQFWSDDTQIESSPLSKLSLAMSNNLCFTFNPTCIDPIPPPAQNRKGTKQSFPLGFPLAPQEGVPPPPKKKNTAKNKKHEETAFCCHFHPLGCHPKDDALPAAMALSGEPRIAPHDECVQTWDVSKTGDAHTVGFLLVFT